MYVIITVTKEVFKFKDIIFITSMYVSIISIYCYKYILLVYFFIIQQLLLNKNHFRLWFFSLSKTVRLLIIAYIHFIWTCVYIFCTFNTLWLVWRVVSLSLKSHLLISILSNCQNVCWHQEHKWAALGLQIIFLKPVTVWKLSWKRTI